jgi:hypothetical protein
MSIFSSAINALFADPNLASGDIWRPGGVSEGSTVRVIVHAGDRIGDLGESRIHRPTFVIEVRMADVPRIKTGDTFAIGDEVYVVQGVPVRDSEHLVLTVDTYPAP